MNCAAYRAPFDMQNEAGEFVDMYIPRRCDVSNQLIGAKDHASISLRLAEVDANTGRMNGEYKTFNISGQIRSMVWWVLNLNLF